jgi:hypothetical protein
MKINKLDSFYITLKIKEHKKNKKKLLSLINKIPKNKLTNVSHSDWSLPKEYKREYLNLFFKIIHPYFNEILKLMHAEEWKIHNAWFHQYSKNDFFDWHTHPKANFSAVYYLEMPKNNMKTKIFNIYNNKLININVKEGDLIIFPAYLLHKSSIINNNLRKTVIAFNCCTDKPKINIENEIQSNR